MSGNLPERPSVDMAEGGASEGTAPAQPIGAVGWRLFRHRIPREVRRRMSLVLAAAENRVLDTHARAAIGFVMRLREEIALERALAVFHRVMEVPAALRRAVTVRTLAELDRYWTKKRLDLARLAGDVADDSPVGRLRRRLVGRRDEQLRERIDRAARPARRAVEEAYICGARDVIAALDGLVPPAIALQAYLDTLGVGRGWAEHIFHTAMAQVSE